MLELLSRPQHQIPRKRAAEPTEVLNTPTRIAAAARLRRSQVSNSRGQRRAGPAQALCLRSAAG